MKKEKVLMSVQEVNRLTIMRQIDDKQLTVRQGSEAMSLCLRQGKRVRKRYIQEKEAGLISRRRNKASNRKIAETIKIQAIERLKTIYQGFGPTLASEKLKEKDGITVSRETLRLWMQEAGLWSVNKKKQKKIHSRRPRRERFGELLQGDGSPHDWFEGRANKCTLLQFVDDATSTITAALFAPTETTEGYLQLLEQHVQKHGRPLSLYVDKHSTFRVNRENISVKGDGKTHFGRVLQALDIQLIFAHSPQAKGRVERKNSVLQDRLTKEMRLEGINSIEEANAFLPSFLQKINERFGKDPFNKEDAHRGMRPQDDFKELCLRKDSRIVSKDLMFHHQGIVYLLQTETPHRMQGRKIDIFWQEQKAIRVQYKGEVLRYKKWADLPYEPSIIMTDKEVGLQSLTCSINKRLSNSALQARKQNYLHSVGF